MLRPLRKSFSFIPFEIWNCNPLLFLNAFLPISFIVLGIVTFVRLLNSAKANLPIVFIPS